MKKHKMGSESSIYGEQKEERDHLKNLGEDATRYH
jgi:hypothetical protein